MIFCALITKCCVPIRTLTTTPVLHTATVTAKFHFCAEVNSEALEWGHQRTVRAQFSADDLIIGRASLAHTPVQ